MRVGIIGKGVTAEARLTAVQDWSGTCAVDRLQAPPDARGGTDELECFVARLEVVFVTVPAAEHFHVARVAAQRGVHVFLEWPPATSVRECEALVRLAEEAGIEAGVSRPLRFHPIFDRLPANGPAGLILLQQALPAAGAVALPSLLADAVDLCSALAGSSSVQRVEAEAVRGSGARPVALAFGLRFHNGSYAQVSLRPEAPGTLFVAGPGYTIEDALGEGRENAVSGVGLGAAVHGGGIYAETLSFLNALAAARPAPVSVLDGLHTLRLVERLMRQLR